MKIVVRIFSTLILTIFLAFNAYSQLDVNWLSGSDNGNWWNDGTGNQLHWIQSNCSGAWVARPDYACGSATIQSNYVHFDNNSNLSMTVNGAWFKLLTLTFESSASSARTLTADGSGGLSFTSAISYLTNSSTANHIFNTGIGVDAATLTINAIAGAMTFNSPIFINANALTFTGDNDNSVSGQISGTGTLTKSGAGTLTFSAANIYTGNTTIEGGMFASSQNLSTALITVKNAATFSATDNISVNSITLEDGAILDIASGKTLTITGTLTIQGGFTVSGGGTIAYGASGTLVYAQTADNLNYNVDLEWPTPIGPPANVTINLTGSGLPKVILDNSKIISGTLTLTAGVINTGTSYNVLVSGTVSGGSETSYVDGKLQRLYLATGAKTFPIGRETTYAPVTVNFTALTGLSTVTAELYNNELLGPMPAGITLFTDHYWRISQSGGSNMQFAVTLDGTGFTATNPVMIRGNDVTNSAYEVTTPNYTNSGSFTSFSSNPNFGLGNSSTTALLSAGSLADFGNVCVNTTAGPNSFTITGTDLTSDDVVVGALNGFTYSTTAGGAYTSTLSLPSVGGSFSATVYVKFTPTAAGSYDGNIPVSGGGASAINVSVTGSGNNTLATVSTTSPATLITTTTATCSGDVTDGGCGSITAGICYGESLNPDIFGLHTTETGTTGAFSSNLANLTPNTLYHFRAYATNGVGTSYGADVTFYTIGNAASSTWDGSESNAWENPANWSDGVPGATTDVTIPSGVTNYPTITSAAQCKDITIASDASLLDESNYLNVSGTATVNRIITDGSDNKWHLFISPITSSIQATSTSCFLGAYVDRYNEPTGAWERLATNDFVTPDIGYDLNFLAGSHNLIFTGTLKSGPINYTNLSYTASAPGYLAGWNLVGNPYTCGLNTELLQAPTEMNAIAYVWDGTGSGNYSTFTIGSVVNSGTIASLQGFFVRTSSGSNSLTLAQTAKVHGGTFLKDANIVPDMLKIAIDGNNYSDLAYVRFDASSTNGFDQQYDAYKLAGLDEAPQLYSILPGEKAAINTLPSIENNPLVPLGLKVGAATTYTLTISGMESFDPNTPIRLDDLKLGTSLDLRLNPTYSFTASPGDIENRFQLRFKSATGVDENPATSIRIFAADHQIHIAYTAIDKGTAYVYSVSGQQIAVSALSAGETLIGINTPGVYLVKVVTDKAVTSAKVVIN